MTHTSCRVLITGANGFIGKNLMVRLGELPGFSVSQFVRGDDLALLPHLVAEADAVVHLAGENRPAEEKAFALVNAQLTETLCDVINKEIKTTGRQIPLVLTSSVQAECDNPYGRSKLAAERAAYQLAQTTDNPVVVFRLPGVFGKWCKPNYNSVVATFCHNIARGLPIQINDESVNLTLVYVDDVVTAVIKAIQPMSAGALLDKVQPEYECTVGQLAAQIEAFEKCRTELLTERVGNGFIRALYATYVSYLPIEKFSYVVPQHTDPRGVFVEMLKTPDSGQFSYFTAYPGITRGGHYHHSKTEKFLVIKGQALFKFRNLLNSELIELRTSGEQPQVVDTIPGWAHDITNIGNEEMVVMLWANENFDRERPDTVASKV